MTARASPAEPLFGDPITLTLELHAPAGYQATFPEASAFTSAAPAEAGTLARTTDGTSTRWVQSYKLQPEAPGDLEIPELPVHYQASRASDSQPADQSEAELRSLPLKLTIRSLLTPEDAPQSPRQITGVLAPPPRQLTPLEWSLIAAGAVVALLLLYALTRAIRTWRNRPPAPIAPDRAALAALDALSRQPLQSQSQMRAFYYALSEIVRQYIERAFGVAAPEMTTEEFLHTVARPHRSIEVARTSGIPLARVPASLTVLATADLRPFLEQCDLVKYAALTPLSEDAHRALSEARTFIERTAAAQRAAAAAQPPSHPSPRSEQGVAA